MTCGQLSPSFYLTVEIIALVIFGVWVYKMWRLEYEHKKWMKRRGFDDR